MPIHDWTRVDPGIFHHFHHSWVSEIDRALNRGLLPSQYYALIERRTAGGPADEVEHHPRPMIEPIATRPEIEARLHTDDPRTRVKAEDELEFYRRKQNVVSVRHASGDELIAIIEVVSRGNKSSRKALDDFIGKAAAFLSRGIHLLILDLQPPTPRDPQGLHGRLWEDMTGDEYQAPPDKPLTLAAYHAAAGLRAFVEPVAVGDSLIDMPLFLTRFGYVATPLEATYQAAFDAVPRRWRTVLEPA